MTRTRIDIINKKDNEIMNERTRDFVYKKKTRVILYCIYFYVKIKSRVYGD